jgi:hypothetical protein
MMPPVSSTRNDLTRLYTLRRCTVFEYILPVSFPVYVRHAVVQNVLN